MALTSDANLAALNPVSSTPEMWCLSWVSQPCKNLFERGWSVNKILPLCVNTLCVGDWGKTKHFGRLCCACKQQTAHWGLIQGETPRCCTQSAGTRVSGRLQWLLSLCVSHLHPPLEFCHKPEKKLHFQIDREFSESVVILNQFWVVYFDLIARFTSSFR